MYVVRENPKRGYDVVVTDPVVIAKELKFNEAVALAEALNTEFTKRHEAPLGRA